MKLALLGADTATLAIVADALAGDVDRVVWACDLGPLDAEVARLAPLAKRTDDWESLLESTIADAVIVARGANDELRLDQLRKLLQAGLPLLVAQPVHDSALAYYELEMVRGESRGALLPILPAREHPALSELFEALAEPEGIGPLEQLNCERFLADRGRAAVRGAFARDIDLIRAIVGEMNKLVAMSPVVAQREPSPQPSDQNTKSRDANLSVQLAGPAGVVARWNVAPVETSPGVRMSLVGRAGKLVLWLADDGAATLIDTRPGQPGERAFPPPRAGRLLVDQLAALAHEQRATRDEQRATRDAEPTDSRWLDAARAMELTEAIERSLARGKMIEIRDDNRSEAEAFKSIMSSAGCLLLLLAPLLFVVGEVAARAGVPLLGNLKWLVLLLFCLFLLLQLLGRIVPPANNPGGAHGAQ